ncbi:hypothetical protein [Mycobacterium deserti]|uniref:Alpha/beta hydrolase n=1 Tax=Mycobacterium deserti TaxID=2978347 RepID=A0ABT2MB76_9MYCO|nr:hypothetical protein [Mycobacterium deserti]MCT7658246.1 hypothetical protein [Mycobacterium deserti]
MNDRFLQWVGAGVLTAGLSTAMLVGATIAAAETESGADGGVSSSQSDASGATRDTDSRADQGSEGSQDSVGNDAAADDAVAEENPKQAGEDAEQEPEEEEIAQEPKEEDDEVPSGGDVTPESSADTKDSSAADKVGDPAPVDEVGGPVTPDADDPVTQPDGTTVVEDSDQPAVEPVSADVVAPVVAEPEAPAPSETEPQTASFMMSAVEADDPAPAQPTLLNIIGSLFFGIFDMVAALFEGPPAVPPGSTVRVGRSVLEIDCGDGYQASTDWYFPTDAEPDKIIYFQHGAFARAGLYNYTAAELAERNNAIVVAPSITSNYFACDGCQMAGEQMHAAIADLFLGDRAALLASAKAAGFTGSALPQRFVIAGHSGGGQTAGGAAGYYAQFAPADRLHDMAGVLLFDTSPIGGAIERGVRKIPLDIPVHAISAEAGPLNDYGGVNEVLARLRPGFVGVQIIGGAHGDAWQSSNAFAQLVVGIGTGFSQPRNIEAVHVLAQGWIADWFNAPDADPIYGERAEVITIDTVAGPARAYVIPGPAPQLTIIDQIIKAFLQSTALLSPFSGNCAADPSAPTAAESPQNSTPNTVLTLDGKASRGQSVGQHVCTG